MIGTVERAFQLAPECTSIYELRGRLAREGCPHVDAHIKGVLRRQLSELLRSA